MRPIRFRVWDFNTKRMDYNVCLGSGNMAVNNDFNFIGFLGTQLLPMQFTGLLDKNGKDIYEGDIIYCELNKAKAVVKYNDKIGQYRFHFFFGGREDLKRQSKYHGTDMSSWFISTGDEIPITVIGNIHENPELINQ